MYKKILVPLDGSPLAESVLPHAEALAKAEDAEIVVLRIPVLPTDEFISRDPAMASIFLKDVEQESEAYIRDEVQKIRLDGFQKVKGIVREGYVPETILSVAEEIHADMIAMSTHGRTGIQRWLMGSVADRVVHYAHIPVVLIHPN